MIYVDRLMPCKANKNWRYNHVSHLTTDGDIDELHGFAKRLLMFLSRVHFQLEIAMKIAYLVQL